MNDQEWERYDEALLTQLGNVRQNVDTTKGTRYTVAFYESFAATLSNTLDVPITAEDVGRRVCRVRDIFQSYEAGTGTYTHTVIASDRFRDLLRRYFFQEFKPIQVPRCLRTNPNIRSRRSTSGCSSSQSVDQAPTYHVASVESPFSEVLAHLHSQHQAGFSPNRLTLFSRYLDHNATAAGA
nr:hypothetical protein [Tanacetum cinerariifolium]